MNEWIKYLYYVYVLHMFTLSEITWASGEAGSPFFKKRSEK